MLDHPLSEQILEAGVAMSVLGQDMAQDQVFYIHQLLQEYFAAQHFAEAPEPELAQQAWQADAVSPGLQEILNTLPDSDPLPPLPVSPAGKKHWFLPVRCRQIPMPSFPN